jgi:hypothetical protein
MPVRRPNDPAIEARVLTRSARRCCLCFQLKRDFTEKEGQIAHLDQNPANGAEENLAFLCLSHHSLFDSRTSQHKNYTNLEVKAARERLYRRVQELLENDGNVDDDGEQEPVYECDEESLIRADSHKPYLFEMSAGQELVASVSAEGFIDIVVCDEGDFDAWSNQDKDEWPAYYFLAEDVRKRSFEFVAPEDGTFVALLINWADEDVEVTIDAAVWDNEDEEE